LQQPMSDQNRHQQRLNQLRQSLGWIELGY
jgi:hypothetical protein